MGRKTATQVEMAPLATVNSHWLPVQWLETSFAAGTSMKFRPQNVFFWMKSQRWQAPTHSHTYHHISAITIIMASYGCMICNYLSTSTLAGNLHETVALPLALPLSCSLLLQFQGFLEGRHLPFLPFLLVLGGHSQGRSCQWCLAETLKTNVDTTECQCPQMYLHMYLFTFTYVSNCKIL